MSLVEFNTIIYKFILFYSCRRLQEVHQRLNELKELVQQYQGIEGGIEALSQPSLTANGTAEAATAAANYEDPDLMSNLR